MSNKMINCLECKKEFKDDNYRKFCNNCIEV